VTPARHDFIEAARLARLLRRIRGHAAGKQQCRTYSHSIGSLSWKRLDQLGYQILPVPLCWNLQPGNEDIVQALASYLRESSMKLFVVAAATVLSTAVIAPWPAHAAGEPQLNSQESAAATNGKSSDQAEKSKMQVKKERDAEKYQGQKSEGTSR
jgi:hypothetical protein